MELCLLFRVSLELGDANQSLPIDSEGRPNGSMV